MRRTHLLSVAIIVVLVIAIIIAIMSTSKVDRCAYVVTSYVGAVLAGLVWWAHSANLAHNDTQILSAHAHADGLKITGGKDTSTGRKRAKNKKVKKSLPPIGSTWDCIDFPYQAYYRTDESIGKAFGDLTKFRLTFVETSANRGKFTRVMAGGVESPASYLLLTNNKIDFIGNVFNEHARISGEPSVARYWEANRSDLLERAKYFNNSPRYVHDLVYKKVPIIRSSLCASVVSGLIKYVISTFDNGILDSSISEFKHVNFTIVDTSAGWGDKLIGTLAAGKWAIDNGYAKLRYIGYSDGVTGAEYNDIIEYLKRFGAKLENGSGVDLATSVPAAHLVFVGVCINEPKSASQVLLRKIWEKVANGGYVVAEGVDADAAVAMPDGEYMGVLSCTNGQDTESPHLISIWRKK